MVIYATESTEIEHRAVQQLIKNYEKDVSYFGKVTFKMLPLNSGQKTKNYTLNEQQATFLMTLFRNNDVVVEFKKRLVEEFYRMRTFLFEKQSAEWQQSRITGKQQEKNNLTKPDFIYSCP